MVVGGATDVDVVVTMIGDGCDGNEVLAAGRVAVGACEVVTVGANDTDVVGVAVVFSGGVAAGSEASFPPAHAAPTNATATNPIIHRPNTSAAL